VTLHADYQRLGKVVWDLQNTYVYDGTDLLNGRISFKRNNLEIAAYGQNILDKKYPAFFSPDGYADGISLRRRIWPFQYGVELRWSF
jgi:outer membrane receptor protein involved in Fe transport